MGNLGRSGAGKEWEVEGPSGPQLEDRELISVRVVRSRSFLGRIARRSPFVAWGFAGGRCRGFWAGALIHPAGVSGWLGRFRLARAAASGWGGNNRVCELSRGTGRGAQFWLLKFSSPLFLRASSLPPRLIHRTPPPRHVPPTDPRSCTHIIRPNPFFPHVFFRLLTRPPPAADVPRALAASGWQRWKFFGQRVW